MSGRESDENRGSTPLAHWIALVLLAILPHLPSLRGGFHSDDEGLIRDNAQLRSVQGLAEIWAGEGNPDYWPLTYTAFWVEHQLWGDSPLPYHLARVLLHAANALLLFFLLRRLRLPGAWAAAALWALHPVTVESVAWLVELKNLLCFFFGLLSMLAYLDFNEGKGRASYALSLLAFALSLLSKSALAALPAIFFLLRRPRNPWSLAPFLTLSALSAVITLRFQGGLGGATAGEPFDFFERLGLAARNACFYLGKTFLPAGICFEYPRIEPATSDFLWLLLLLALAGFFLWLRRRWKEEAELGLRGMGIYFLALFPVLGFFDLYFFRFSFVADRWQYFALPVPIALSCAAVARALGERRGWGVALFGIAALALGVLTWNQSLQYRDSRSLWEDTLRKNPAAAMAHAGLGHELRLQGKLEEAAAHFGEAARNQPRYLEAHDDLALVLQQLEKFDEAESVWKELMAADPRFAPANLHYARFLIGRDRHAEAIPLLESNLARFPNWAEGHLMLGAAYIETGHEQKAAMALWNAQRMLPDSGELRSRLDGLKARLAQSVRKKEE